MFSAFDNKPGRRWLVWVVCVSLWTAALVAPMPADRNLPPALTGLTKFLLGKTLHFCVYVFLAVLSAWLRVSFRFRLLLLFFLMLHAAATEFVQLHVSNRTGTLGDVLLDHIGIGAGLILGWKGWSKADD